MIATYQIRWLIRRDVPEVMGIERCSFEYPWTEDDLICCLRQRNVIGATLIKDHTEVHGFMIYELHESSLRLLNMAVHPDHRCEGLGTQMITRLKEKLSEQRRTEIVANVRESNLQALDFLKGCGFFAERLLRGHYVDTQEDAIVMSYSLVPDVAF